VKPASSIVLSTILILCTTSCGSTNAAPDGCQSTCSGNTPVICGEGGEPIVGTPCGPTDLCYNATCIPASAVNSGDTAAPPTPDVIKPVKQNQCTNSADRAIINDPKINQHAEAEKCVVDCIGAGDVYACGEICLVDATGLSTGCSSCYVNLERCAIERCLTPCAAGSATKGCISCKQEQGCSDGFDQCSGIVS